jgi:hypothetical protein
MNKFDAPQYLQLNKGGALARLNILKMKASAYNTNRPPSTQIDWRKARDCGFNNCAAYFGALGQGFNTENAGTKREKRTPIWYCHTGAQFRHECDAHEVEGVRMNHTGWYADPDGNNLYVAIVAQLTHGRYIAGYRSSDTGERVYFAKVFTGDDAQQDAAAHGDSEAERLAEKEYEYQERYQDAQALDSSINDQKHELRKMLALRHTDGFDDASSYRDIEEAIAELRADKARFESEYSDVEF